MGGEDLNRTFGDFISFEGDFRFFHLFRGNYFGISVFAKVSF